jgi:hypothetical protein
MNKGRTEADGQTLTGDCQPFLLKKLRQKERHTINVTNVTAIIDIHAARGSQREE